MQSKPLRPNLSLYLIKHNLVRKYHKQVKLLETNLRHPSLNMERLEPKHLRLYSFRVDKQFRAIFIITNNLVEVVDINNHYQ